MKGSAISAFQIAIVVGLGLQALILVCGVMYSLHTAEGSANQSTGAAVLPSSGLRSDPALGQRRQGETAGNSQPVHHPLQGLIQTFADPRVHDPTSRRNCFSFTSVPGELDALLKHVKDILQYGRYADVIDCIHLSIPHRSLRFGGDDYPKTKDLLQLVDDPRIIVHRLFDYGPMTRYIGPLSYEQHGDTSIVIFDMDSNGLIGSKDKDLVALFHAARKVDADAMWCLQGENFWVENGMVKPKWDTFPLHRSRAVEWNLVHFCRGVGGLLFKPKQFTDFWYNQSEYHESCFWDDDRWVGYQMERVGVPLKVVHPNVTHWLDLSLVVGKKHSARSDQLPHRRRLRVATFASAMRNVTLPDSRNSITAQHRRRLGSLTVITNQLKSDQTCPLAWLKHHPDAFPTARFTKS